MAEMGRTDPSLALRIYAQAIRRDRAEIERLRALVDGRMPAPAIANRTAPIVGG